MRARILVVCPIGLGNFLMAEPAMRMLSEHFGADRCELLALRGGIAELGRESGLFGRIHLWDPDKQHLLQGLKLIWNLRRHKYTWIISLFPTGHWKYSAFLSLLRTDKRAGFNYAQNPLASFSQKPSLCINLQRHDTEQNLRLACAITGRSCPVDSAIVPPIRPLASAPIPCEPFFVCHPGSSAERLMEHKRAKPELFAQLIHQIHQEFGFKCILIGGPEEAHLRSQIAEHCPSECLLDRPTKSLADLSAVIGSSLFFLGNDSGLMHIAASLQRPIIAFFGPTDEKRTGPWAAPKVRNLILRQSEFSCGPCWTLQNLGHNQACPKGDYPCLIQFPLESAWNQIRQFLHTQELEPHTF